MNRALKLGFCSNGVNTDFLIFYTEGLKDLLEPFRKNHIPLIVLHEQHTSYGIATGKSHEAGFDSAYPFR